MMSELFSVVHTLAYPCKEVAYRVSSIDLPPDIPSNSHNDLCAVVVHWPMPTVEHWAVVVMFAEPIEYGRWPATGPIRTWTLAAVDSRLANRVGNGDRDQGILLVGNRVTDMVGSISPVDVGCMVRSMLADMWDNAIDACSERMDQAREWVGIGRAVAERVDIGMCVVDVVDHHRRQLHKFNEEKNNELRKNLN